MGVPITQFLRPYEGIINQHDPLIRHRGGVSLDCHDGKGLVGISRRPPSAAAKVVFLLVWQQKCPGLKGRSDDWCVFLGEWNLQKLNSGVTQEHLVLFRSHLGEIHRLKDAKRYLQLASFSRVWSLDHLGETGPTKMARKLDSKNPAISREIAKFPSEEALDPEKWHFPDGFFPFATMIAVHRSPERQDSVEQ